MRATKWHVFLVLLCIKLLASELDADVWADDEALERTRAYLDEIKGHCGVAEDYIVRLQGAEGEKDA